MALIVFTQASITAFAASLALLKHLESQPLDNDNVRIMNTKVDCITFPLHFKEYNQT